MHGKADDRCVLGLQRSDQAHGPRTQCIWMHGSPRGSAGEHSLTRHNRDGDARHLVCAWVGAGGGGVGLGADVEEEDGALTRPGAGYPEV